MKTKEVLIFFKNYLKDDKKTLIIASILTFISSLSSTLYGILIGESTEFITNNVLSKALLFLGIYLLIALVNQIFFGRLAKKLFYNISQNLMDKISVKLYNKILYLPPVAFEDKSSGEYINRITNDSSNVSDTLSSFVSIISYLIGTIIIFIYISFHSLIIAGIIVFYMIIMYFISIKMGPFVKEKEKEITKIKDASISEINESIKGIREVKSLGITSTIFVKTKGLINETFKERKKQYSISTDYQYLGYLTSSLLEVSSFIAAFALYYYGYLSLGFVIALTYYIYRFTGIIEWVTDYYTKYQKMLVSIGRINEITENKLYEDESFGNNKLINPEGKIVFENVTFKYKEDESYIFEDFNLEILPNQITAFVGTSGSGKSSIFNMILKFFKIEKGNIYIDKTNIDTLTEDSLRDNISVIRQEPFLFNKTIFENFKILNENITIEEVTNVCKKAQIDEYIQTLPKKYETIIGEGGVNFSGGQKQRIAIARALIKDSKIILLDEATSALDNNNQEKITEVIENLSKNHTVIIIAHRLSTIINADKIYVLEKGKVVDSGNHESLLKNSNYYKNLYKKEL